MLDTTVQRLYIDKFSASAVHGRYTSQDPTNRMCWRQAAHVNRWNFASKSTNLPCLQFCKLNLEIFTRQKNDHNKTTDVSKPHLSQRVIFEVWLSPLQPHLAEFHLLPLDCNGFRLLQHSSSLQPICTRAEMKIALSLNTVRFKNQNASKRILPDDGSSSQGSRHSQIFSPSN